MTLPRHVACHHPAVQVHIQKADQVLKGHSLCHEGLARPLVTLHHKGDAHRKVDPASAHVRKVLLVLRLHIDLPERCHARFECRRIRLRPARGQFFKIVGQHIVRVISEPLKIVCQAVIHPVPTTQHLILCRPHCEHPVQLLLIATQLIDNAADRTSAPLPVRKLVVQGKLTDKLPGLVQRLNCHPRAGCCPRGQKYTKLLAGLLGQLF